MCGRPFRPAFLCRAVIRLPLSLLYGHAFGVSAAVICEDAQGAAPDCVAREFEPSAEAIRNWVAQADRDAGERTDGLSTEDGEELRRLRRENRRLREEREILAKATAWFAREIGPGRSSGS